MGSKPKKERLSAVLAAVLFWISAIQAFFHVRAFVFPSVDSFCSVGENFDCDAVALSSWSVILGVPVPVWGMVAFAFTTYVAIFRRGMLRPLTAALAIGALGLLLIQIIAIGSVCLLCELVHALVFVLAYLSWKKPRASIDLGKPVRLGIELSIPVVALLLFKLLVPNYWVLTSWKGDVPFDAGVTAQGHPWIGAKDPKVTVQEFIDYTCPHCAISTMRTRMLLAYSAERVRIVRRQNPRMRCKASDSVAQIQCSHARAAYCAGRQLKDPKAFWKADAWLFSNADPQKGPNLATMAKDLKLDEVKLTQCTNSEAAYKYADAGNLEARTRKMQSTPGYILNGEKSDLSAVVQAMSAR